MDNKKSEEHLEEIRRRSQAARQRGVEAQKASENARYARSNTKFPPHLIDSRGVKRCSVCRMPFRADSQPSIIKAFAAHVLKAHGSGGKSSEDVVAVRPTPDSLGHSPKRFRINHGVVGIERSTFCHGFRRKFSIKILPWVQMIVDKSSLHSLTVRRALFTLWPVAVEKLASADMILLRLLGGLSFLSCFH